MTKSYHREYFRAKIGRWSGPFRLEITQSASDQKLPWGDRLTLRFLAILSRWVDGLVMSTTVNDSSQQHPGTIIHTTRLSLHGITIARSEEVISPADDGVRFQIKGRRWSFPFIGSGTTWSGEGSVSTDHDGASYHISILGQMTQTTRMTPNGLEIIQTTPFSRATILLRWLGPLAP